MPPDAHIQSTLSSRRTYHASQLTAVTASELTLHSVQRTESTFRTSPGGGQGKLTTHEQKKLAEANVGKHMRTTAQQLSTTTQARMLLCICVACTAVSMMFQPPHWASKQATCST